MMQKITFFLFILIIYPTQAWTKQQCFILADKKQILYQQGDFQKRYAPCSTFKIALSLIGYDSGVLTDELHPELDFQKGNSDFLSIWKQNHTPTTWIKNSCVWYSQVLTKKLGMIKLEEYITKFRYGNMDLSGDKNRNNGITNAWLSNSLEIFSEEQGKFLQQLAGSYTPC